MKRSTAIKTIQKVLKKWEDCKLTKKTANEVLTSLEHLDLLAYEEPEKEKHNRDNLDCRYYNGKGYK